MTGGVVRVGDTVRRPAGPSTTAVHALLAHLADAGVPGVPRPLGLDGHGRQVLSFVPGDPVFPDRTRLYGTGSGLAGIARYVRSVHDALAGFRPPPDTRWDILLPDPGDGPVQVVHHDVAPWNVVGSPVDGWGLVDWDGAGPGTREWDLAWAAIGLVPLFPDDVPFPGGGLDVALQAGRLRVLADAYGLDDTARRRLLERLPQRPAAMAGLLAGAGGRDGVEPWARLWRAGHGRTWSAVTSHVRAHRTVWHRALLG